MQFRISAFFVLFVLVAACGNATPTEDPGSPSGEASAERLAEAEASAEYQDALTKMSELGWETQEGPQVIEDAAATQNWAVRHTLTRDGQRISLMYVHDGDDVSIVVGKANENAAPIAVDELVEPPQEETKAGCSPGCYGSNCKNWSCKYLSRKGYTWACLNDAFAYTEYTLRWGYTDPAACVGWYADWYGHGVSCPYPNSSYTWRVCGG